MDDDVTRYVARAPLVGGELEVLATMMTSPKAQKYELGPDDVFYTAEKHVWAVAKAGGVPRMLAEKAAANGAWDIQYVEGTVVVLAFTGGGIETHSLRTIPEAGGEYRTHNAIGCHYIAGMAATASEIYASARTTRTFCACTASRSRARSRRCSERPGGSRAALRATRRRR